MVAKWYDLLNSSKSQKRRGSICALLPQLQGPKILLTAVLQKSKTIFFLITAGAETWAPFFEEEMLRCTFLFQHHHGFIFHFDPFLMFGAVIMEGFHLPKPPPPVILWGLPLLCCGWKLIDWGVPQAANSPVDWFTLVENFVENPSV